MRLGTIEILVILGVVAFYAVFIGLGIYLLVTVIRALNVYIKVNTRAREVKKETAAVRKSLAETLKEHRTRCKMTQEFVAESVGVSRQAVSKWETGVSQS